MTTPVPPDQPEQCAQPQVIPLVKPVSIETLRDEREKYDNAPVYQRKKGVWSLKYNQWLINSILTGRSIPALIAYRELDASGTQTYWITDGRQRLSAILDFLDGKFKTWTPLQKQLAEPNSVAPIEPGKRFESLSPLAQRYFLDYVVNITVEPKRSDEEQREAFRGSQNQVPLSGPEKIFTYISRANDAAALFEQHTFWDDFYFGLERHRGKVKESSLYWLAFELSSDGMANVGGTAFIHRLASGARDEEVTPAVIGNIQRRIEVICHLFSGTQFSARGCAIIMYQTVILMEKANIPLQDKHKGCLTNWLTGVIYESDRASIANVTGYHRPLQHLVRPRAQDEFWVRHIGIIMAILRDPA